MMKENKEIKDKNKTLIYEIEGYKTKIEDFEKEFNEL